MNSSTTWFRTRAVRPDLLATVLSICLLSPSGYAVSAAAAPPTASTRVRFVGTLVVGDLRYPLSGRAILKGESVTYLGLDVGSDRSPVASIEILAGDADKAYVLLSGHSYRIERSIFRNLGAFFRLTETQLSHDPAFRRWRGGNGHQGWESRDIVEIAPGLPARIRYVSAHELAGGVSDGWGSVEVSSLADWNNRFNRDILLVIILAAEEVNDAR